MEEDEQSSDANLIQNGSSISKSNSLEDDKYNSSDTNQIVADINSRNRKMNLTCETDKKRKNMLAQFNMNA